MSEGTPGRGAHAPGGAAAARRALVTWVREGGDKGREFLQAYVVARGDRFAVRHVEDRNRPAGELEGFADPYEARSVAQTTAEGAHRPLKTAPNLRRGWRFEGLDEQGLWTVLDYLYPAAVPHWHAGREGSLRVTHWQETAARQSGIYSVVRLLPEPAVRDVVRACCGDAVCLRRVAWGFSEADPEPIPSEDPDAAKEDPEREGARVPCPEACSIFISFARAVLEVERSPRSETEGFGRLNEVEREQIRTLIEVAAGMRRSDAREGEFELPMNQRRLRYLAIRTRREAGEEEGREPIG